MIQEINLGIADVSKETILSTIDEFDIYSFYYNAKFGDNKFKLNQRVLSPFREENNPSVYFYVSSSDDRIYWRDWGDGNQEKPSDVFDFVKKFYNNCNYFEALEHINKDLGLSIGKENFTKLNPDDISGKTETNVSFRMKQKASLTYKERRFFVYDIIYWEKNYGIRLDQFSDYGIIPILDVYIGDELVMKSTPYRPIYGFRMGESIKIYAPSGPIKWLCSGRIKDYIWGLDSIPKNGVNLIITKSLKDMIVLRNCGFNSISIQSESSSIPQDIYEDISKRYMNIYLLFDNDKSGVENSERIKKEFKSIKILSLPKFGSAKDSSDFRQMYGNDIELKFLISNLIAKYE